MPVEEARETRDDANTTAGDFPPRRNRSSVPSFLFVSFLLFMLTNNRGEEIDARFHYLKALSSLNNQVSNYSAWLNGTTTNFVLYEQDGATIPLVDAFVSFGTRPDPEIASFYTNLTGFWHGEVHLHNLTSTEAGNSTLPAWSKLADDFVSRTNLTALPELLGSWDWSTSEKLSISVGDRTVLSPATGSAVSDDISAIHGKIELTNPNSSDELRLDFDGVHFISNGSIYAFAEPSGKAIDVRMVPSLVPVSLLNETAHVIETELIARVARLKEKIEAGSIDQDNISNEENSLKTRCSFQLYAQLVPSEVPELLMKELEGEIEKPTGIATIKPPELRLDGILVSQDCGILYEIKDTIGLKSPQLYRKITTYAGLATIVYIALLVLLQREVVRASSTAVLSRLSRYVFLSQSLIDAISFVGHITLAILADGRPSLAVLAPAGLACMLFIQEAQFAVLIGQIQAPEDVTPSPPRPSPSPSPAPAATAVPPATPTSDSRTETPTPDATATYPPPAAQPGAQAQNTPAAPSPTATVAAERPSFLRFLWQHIRSDPSARLWMTISLFLIFVFRIVIILSLPLFFVGSLYSFIWMGQIYRSARRGRSSGLSAEYLIGATLCRLYFALYFLGCPNNILDVEPRKWIYAVAATMLFQILIIWLQDHVGPTFFLGNRMVATKIYDYHPPLPLPDPEAPEQTLGDCAICMDAIEIDPSLRRRSKSSDGKERGDLLGLATGAHRSGGILGAVGASGSRRNYSLAPCHHLFHTACLERWLAIKNICPQCRRPLPPL